MAKKPCPNAAMPHRSFTTFVVELRQRGAPRSKYRCLECGYEWEGDYTSPSAAAADDAAARRLID
jgi:transposase-like protein